MRQSEEPWQRTWFGSSNEHWDGRTFKDLLDWFTPTREELLRRYFQSANERCVRLKARENADHFQATLSRPGLSTTDSWWPKATIENSSSTAIDSAEIEWTLYVDGREGSYTSGSAKVDFVGRLLPGEDYEVNDRDLWLRSSSMFDSAITRFGGERLILRGCVNPGGRLDRQYVERCWDASRDFDQVSQRMAELEPQIGQFVIGD